MTTEPIPQFRELLRPENPNGQQLRPQVTAPSSEGHQFELFLKRAEPSARPNRQVETSADREVPVRAERQERSEPSVRNERNDRNERRRGERPDRSDERGDTRTDDRAGDPGDDRRIDDDKTTADDGQPTTDGETGGDDAASSEREAAQDDSTAQNAATDELDAAEATIDGIQGELVAALLDDVSSTEVAADNAVAAPETEAVEAGPVDARPDAVLLEDVQQVSPDDVVVDDEIDTGDEVVEEAVAGLAAVVPGLTAEEETDEQSTGSVADELEVVDSVAEVVDDGEHLETSDDAKPETGQDSAGDQAMVEEAPSEAPATATRTTGAETAGQAVSRADRPQAAAATTSSATAAVSRVDGPQASSTSRTTAPAAAGATSDTGAVVDGDPGDPLWMQVRRAMNSLRALENGDQQVTIRLRPAELGSVMVRVAAGETQTVVSLVADSAVAASQLAQQRQQLIDELEQSGMLGVAVDVGTDSGADSQNSADASGDGDEPGTSGNVTNGVSALTGAARTADGLLGIGRSRGPGRSGAGSLIDLDL
jgi:ribonuclease E